jgi:hypothetical protein
MDELYDLRDDPYEMRNLIDAPAARPAKEEMSRELGRLLAATGHPSYNGAALRRM